jgi:hypothetical protein
MLVPVSIQAAQAIAAEAVKQLRLSGDMRISRVETAQHLSLKA